MNNIYFFKIQSDQFDSDLNNFDIFEQDELSKISKYLELKQNKKKYHISFPGTKACVISFSNSDDCYSSSIFKLKDEWYIVTFYIDEKKYIYKCDQIEGLLKLLGEILRYDTDL